PVDPWEEAPGITAQEAGIVRSQIDRNLNTPLTSAAGRLFDAVAALAGVRQHVSYEAQAAIELEMMASGWQDGRQSADKTRPYPFQMEAEEAGTVIGLRELIGAIRSDLEMGRSQAEIGWRFHLTMAQMIATVCQQIAKESGLRTVALSGGCFQNRLLLGMAVQRLEQAGFTALLHRRVPCNDGGISLGQVALARAEAE
ncbi:MAG: carbamoyltransferase HypF, partial [Anaerolineae bacterium]